MCIVLVIIALISFISINISMDSKMEQDIVIYVNSKNKISGIVGDFTVNLTRPITQIKGFQILGVEIPYSWYNVRIGDAGLCRKGGLDYADYFYPNIFTFTSANNTLVFNVNGQLYPVNLSLGVLVWVIPNHGPAHWAPLIYTLTNTLNQLQTDVLAQLPNCTGCVITYTNYKVTFTLTMSVPFNQIGIMLNGSTLGNILGLAYDDLQFYNVNVYSSTIVMQHEISFVNDIDLTTYASQLLNVPSITGSTFAISGSVAANVVTISADFINLNDYDRTNGFHPLARKWGYRSSKTGPSMIGDSTMTTPIRPPLFFDNGFGISAIINDGGINQGVLDSFNNIMQPGYYSYTDLCTAIKTTLTGTYTDPATTVTFNNTTGLITVLYKTTINMLTANFVVATRSSPGGLRFTRLLDVLGFTNRSLTTVDARTFTATSTIPFPLRSKNIYISSRTLAGLKVTQSDLDLDNPSTIIQNVLYRVPLQSATPGTVITSRLQERPPVQLVNKNISPITSIDFQIWHEDGDLVDLNGRDWAIGVRILI